MNFFKNLLICATEIRQIFRAPFGFLILKHWLLLLPFSENLLPRVDFLYQKKFVRIFLLSVYFFHAILMCSFHLNALISRTHKDNARPTKKSYIKKIKVSTFVMTVLWRHSLRGNVGPRDGSWWISGITFHFHREHLLFNAIPLKIHNLEIFSPAFPGLRFVKVCEFIYNYEVQKIPQ